MRSALARGDSKQRVADSNGSMTDVANQLALLFRAQAPTQVVADFLIDVVASEPAQRLNHGSTDLARRRQMPRRRPLQHDLLLAYGNSTCRSIRQEDETNRDRRVEAEEVCAVRP